MSDTAKDILTRLSPEQRELLLRRISEKKDHAQTRIPVRKDTSDRFPLSFAQQRLWFLDQLEPGSSAYTIPSAVRLSGTISMAAFEWGAQQIVQRHESLRTTFASEQGTPIQIIASHGSVSVPLIDLRDMHLSHRQKLVASLVQQEADRPFDLVHGPLLRLYLLRLNDQEHILLLTMHHIISDGWSTDVLVGELSQFYQGIIHGKAVSLPALPIQYADYALWQREWLQGERLQEQLDYWLKQLADAPLVHSLPLDRQRPAVQSYVGARQAITLSHTLRRELEALSQREGATLFMTLLVSFQILLMKLSGQNDIVVGTPVANRRQKELEGLIGFFVNTLALRTNLSGDPTFRQALTRMREVALQAYAHQDLPFEQLVNALPIERSLNHTPFFQILFVLQNTPQEATELETLRVESVELELKTSKFDLTLDVQTTEVGLWVGAEYNTDLFDASTIQQVLQRFQTLLEGIVSNPEQHLSALTVMRNYERKALLDIWSKLSDITVPDRCLHQLFEEQVRRYPHSIALISVDGVRLEYAEVNRRANRLAHYLTRADIGPEARVGICMERSIDLIIGILAILKAGGAYVPLDPAYPSERLGYMLQDAHASLLLTEEALLERFSAEVRPENLAILCLDRDLELYRHEPINDLAVAVQPGNLAYIIYTSGSTGKPKGVGVCHAQVTRLFAATQPHYHFTEQDCWTHFHSVAFDFSVWEIWGALLYGGRLLVVSYWVSRSPMEFAELLQRERVTILNQTPSAFYALQQTILSRKETDLALRLIIFGGEALDPARLRPWVETYGNIHPTLVNMYGITETTVHVTYAPMHKAMIVDSSASMIGQPLADLQMYLLDASMQPVAPGVYGEIYVGGAGLARGYIEHPELTAIRFLPHPFSSSPGARLYRTGDQARFLVDGTFEYQGRIDQQVKLRGFRIELGEIEAVVSLHPSVQTCLAIVHNELLVAYVTLTDPADSLESIKAHAQAYLPAYMRPSFFIVLPELPLTPNGKIDRKALPTPEGQQTSIAAYREPQTEIEKKIIAAWSEVLPVTQIGLKDNFFDLGGHSLSIVKVFERLKTSLKPDLTLVNLFQYPTVEALARFLHPEEAPIPIQQIPENTDVVVTPNASNTADIAIIGIAGRFPKARDVQEFWNNLQQGVEAISFFSDDELLASGIEPHEFNHPNYVRAGAVLDDIELFDAAFFGYSPREAEIIDPQQRLFLECCWQALENGGYNPEEFQGEIGIFAGSGTNRYLITNLLRNQKIMEAMGLYQLGMGNGNDYLTTRVSYKLNLHGPSITVQTACSTSLVAVHMACESLRSGESDMALAGGVSLQIPSKVGYLYEEGGIDSPDGHCRAFDASSQGTITGDGLGVVLLKRLPEAQADGDFIYAVIKGSAINNDGRAKVGYTAPGVQGQARVIQKAMAMAHVEPETINYIEAHGTGTPLGDPIEIAALRQVYGNNGTHKSCSIGSVKTNVGHLGAAAGIAGLLKTVLALQKQELPPSLHFKEPNSALELSNSPFSINATLRPWIRNGVPRRAGVSSFGIGGTNAHIILEEAPLPEPMTTAQPSSQLIVLSARSESALNQIRINLVHSLQQQTTWQLADVAYTLQVGRQSFKHRLAVVCSDEQDAVQVLNEPHSPRIRHFTSAESHQTYAFMFSGQGSQYVHMGEELYHTEPAFKEAIDTCADLLASHIHLDIRTLLYPTEEETAACTEQLHQTWLTQPALFVTEYALAQLWIERGISPAVMIGHSIGEYVAACLAGVFSLADALLLVAARGRLMQELPSGSMLMVALSEAQVQKYLQTDFAELSLAAHNSDANCVLSGSTTEIERLRQHLDKAGIFCRRLHTSHAFHSRMMEPILESFRSQVNSITLRTPQCAYLSNLTGTWITPQQATDPDYWVEHLRQPVRFAEGLQVLLQDTTRTLLEVGPGRTLSMLARRHTARSESQQVLSSLRHPQDQLSDRAFFLTTCAQLWGYGGTLNWAGSHTVVRARRIPLPTYPFERLRYWVLPDMPLSIGSASTRPQGEQESVEEPKEIKEHHAIYSRPDLSTAYVAPRSVQEQRIAQIWQTLLGIDQIGIHDNFFELNGDSLLATQVVTHVRKEYKLEIPLSTLFAQPTIADLAQQVEQAQPHGQKDHGQELIAVARNQVLPLSFAQLRLWFLDQLEPANAAYTIPVALRSHGQVERPILEQALATVIQRHENLRTTFPGERGEPMQRIAPAPLSSLIFVDLDALREPEREQEARNLALQEMKQPFNLSKGPLLRSWLLRLSEQEHILLLIMHHIISDGWSGGILMYELSSIYTSLHNGEPVDLPELPIQYADYAFWQRQWMQGEVLQQQLNYWKENLAGLMPLTLPTDYPRPAIQTVEGAQHIFYLPAELSQDLRTLSQREGVTLFMILLAAFQILLARYSGQQDIAVGTPIANRTRAEIEGLIGCFVNTLVLRCNLSGNPSFTELLARVRTVALGAYAHQEVPFEQIVDAVQPERDRSRSPLFQVLFALQNMPASATVQSDLQSEEFSIEQHTAKFELSLIITEQEQGLHAVLEYNTNLFTSSTIAQMEVHWRNILEEIRTNPEQPIGNLSLLSTNEREHLLVRGKGAGQEYPVHCIHQIFEAQVEQAPDSVALVYEEGQLTYAVLNRYANQLAHHLQTLGVEPDVLVGICMERSPELIIGLLGILKAGGAYVPLDPTYPQERLAFMVTDAQLPILLTQQDLQSVLPATQAQIICLDTAWKLVTREATGNPTHKVTADNLAYSIYTSGSTGKPKGALISHANVTRLLAATDASFHFNSNDTWTFFHSYAFDFSVWEIWGSLLYGGRLAIVSYLMSRSPEAFYQLLLKEQVTVLNQTPSAFDQLSQAEQALNDREKTAALALRVVIFGGEALELRKLKGWFQRHGDQSPRLINMYGITETTVHVTYCPIQQSDLDRPSAGIIGNSLPDLQLYILDRYQQLQPAGVPGEMYIGGAGLARGYLKRPDLTAERFIPDPWATLPGSRLYKTGDLARYRPDGGIEYLGRIDHQVKIRGFRIELGEIEQALSKHTAVSDCMVMVREDPSGEPRLIAYVVLATGQENPATSELRQFLQVMLPDYMVPAIFLPLSSWPTTPNGKLDRDALPSPDEQRLPTGTTYVAPNTPTEKILAEIWQQVLDVERIGIYDNFFVLGGDSIRSIQVLARVHEQGLPATLQQMFQYQTIHELAQIVQVAQTPVPEKPKMQAFALLSEEDRAKLHMLQQTSN